MPDLQLEFMPDIIKTTFDKVRRAQWIDLTNDLQEHTVMGRLLKKSRIRMAGGSQFKFDIVKRDSGTSRYVAVWEPDAVNQPEIMAQGVVPIRHMDTNWSFHDLEDEANQGPEEIVDLLKARRFAAQISHAGKFEQAYWGVAVPSTDIKTPWGIKTYLVPNATTGFNGGNPVGFPNGVAGIDVADVERYKNFTGEWNEFTLDDFIDLLNEAATKTRFMSPVPFPNFKLSEQFGIFTDFATQSNYKKMLRVMNDDTGADTETHTRGPKFKGIPMDWVPYLDQDGVSQSELFMFNFAYTFVIVRKGKELRERRPSDGQPSQNSHYEHTGWFESSWNLGVSNKREQAYLRQAA